MRIILPVPANDPIHNPALPVIEMIFMDFDPSSLPQTEFSHLPARVSTEPPASLANEAVIVVAGEVTPYNQAEIVNEAKQYIRARFPQGFR